MILSARAVYIAPTTDLREYDGEPLNDAQVEHLEQFEDDPDAVWTLTPGLIGWAPYTHTLSIKIGEDTFNYHAEIEGR